MNFLPLGGNLTYPLIIEFVLFGLLIWGTVRDSRVFGWKKWLLFGLRAAVLLILFWILLRPTRVTTETRRDNSTIAILVDSSRSMGIADAGLAPANKSPAEKTSAPTRYASAWATLSQHASELQSVQQETELKLFTFDKSLAPGKWEQGKANTPALPEGKLSALGYSMEELLRQEAGKRILGVFLLTDGAQRLPILQQSGELDILPQSAAQAYKRLGIPIYSLCFGQPEGQAKSQDITVVDFNAPPRVFLNSSAVIQAQVRIDGFTGVEIPVQLLFETSPGKMEPVAQSVIKAENSGQVVPVRFEYQPKTAGEFKMSLEIPPLKSEDKTDNNAMDAFIRVIDGGLKVLYIEGAIRPEQKFICRDFEDSPYAQVDVIRLNRKSPVDDSELIKQLKKNEYNVIILGDVHSSMLGTNVQEEIVQLVKNGTGLFLLGGFNAYGPGGYAQTPLNAVIPIVMDRFEQQNPDDAPASDLHLDRPIRMLPTAAGGTNPVLTLNDADPAGIWKKLPPLDGANKWKDVKPGAQIWAITADSSRTPLMVSSQIGDGRVLAFAADSTWRWTMAGFGAEHQRFWIQSIFWLSQKEKTKDNRVQLAVDKRRVPCGGTIEFSAEALASDGKPVDVSCFNLIVQSPDGQKIPLPMQKEDDKLIARFNQTAAVGDYQYVLTAIREGEALGRIQGRFQTWKQDVELDAPASAPDVLRHVAAISGGEYIEQSQANERLSALFNKLVQQAQTLEIKREILHSLWDSVWILIAVIALLCIEWTLRKIWTNV